MHHLGGTDLSWMKYDFPGRLLNTRLQHNTSITTAIVNQRFTYDHASRILNTFHQIGDVPTPEKLISAQSYNESDELATKTLGGGLQAIDYSYNIRMWLTMINDPSGLNGDLFSQKLYYNAPPTTNNATFNATPQYNGNISFSEWRTGSSSGINGSTRNLAGYAYAYRRSLIE